MANKTSSKNSESSNLISFNPMVLMVVGFLVLLLMGSSVAIGILWSKTQNGGGNGGGNGQANNNGGTPTQPTAPAKVDLDPVSDEDYVRGSRDAKIALIEYSDLECPFCKNFHLTAKQLIEEYDGQVMWVYRDFPLDSLHSKARKEAEAAKCAGKLGGNDAYWAYIDEVYSVTPANNGLDLAKLPEIAGQIGLNVGEFNACLDSGEMADAVQADYTSGIKAGVRGTPGNFLLNVETGETEALRGAVSYESLKASVDQMLK